MATLTRTAFAHRLTGGYKCQCTLSTTHVHNGTFVTHSSYGLHAAAACPPLFLRHESQDAQTARPPLFMLSLLCSRSSPGFVIGPDLHLLAALSHLWATSGTERPQGLVAQTPYSMAGTLTQPSATVRAPPAPSRSWHTMDTRVVYNLCFDLLVLYVTLESTSSAPHRHVIKDPGIATSQVTRCAGLATAHEETRGACTRSPPGSFANYTAHHAPEYAVGGSYSHALLAGSHPLSPYGWQPPTDLQRRTTRVAF